MAWFYISVVTKAKPNTLQKGDFSFTVLMTNYTLSTIPDSKVHDKVKSHTFLKLLRIIPVFDIICFATWRII